MSIKLFNQTLSSSVTLTFLEPKSTLDQTISQGHYANRIWRPYRFNRFGHYHADCIQHTHSLDRWLAGQTPGFPTITANTARDLPAVPRCPAVLHPHHRQRIRDTPCPSRMMLHSPRRCSFCSSDDRRTAARDCSVRGDILGRGTL